MKKLNIAIVFLLILNIFLILLNLEIKGYIYHNDYNASKYEIHGLDISHHQGKIDFSKVENKYKFILIKATEGGDHLDTYYKYNIENAKNNGFYVGSYHFFNMIKKGKTQARWFVQNTIDKNNDFSPIVDFEISTRYDTKKVLQELSNYISYVEKEYNNDVIIYTNYKVYNKYLKGQLTSNKIWIRDIKWKPRILENKRWIMWQYSNRGIVSGIKGFVDKNVLRYNDINKYLK